MIVPSTETRHKNGCRRYSAYVFDKLNEVGGELRDADVRSRLLVIMAELDGYVGIRGREGGGGITKNPRPIAARTKGDGGRAIVAKILACSAVLERGVEKAVAPALEKS